MLKSLHPEKIRLESCTFCQLNCIDCPNSKNLFEKSIGYSFLKSKDFDMFLKSNSLIKEIELSNYGEAFLNPEIISILSIAFKSNIKITLDNGVNLNYLTDELAESIVKYNVQSITCSIDGCYDTYNYYRQNGSFLKVLNNIKLIKKYKEKYQSNYPILTWQYILFPTNLSDLEQAKEYASLYEMKFKLKLSWGNQKFTNKQRELIKSHTGYSDRREYHEINGDNYRRRNCYQLWESPQINWDGALLGCCRNYWQTYDVNVFEIGLKKALASESYYYTKLMLMGLVKEDQSIPCVKCSIYKDLKGDNKWIDRNEISW